MERVRGPNCAKCVTKPCYRNPDAPRPSFCPANLYPHIFEKVREIYRSNEFVARIARIASIVEKEGYGVWPRLREIVEFAKRLGLKRLGLAFCIGLSEEARKVVEYLESQGFEVYSVCCKCGSIDKTELGLSEEQKLVPGTFEAICNPVAQALILNEVGTELNIVLGLCVGHDTLFTMFSRAPVTYLAVKDRVTGHNPLAAIYAMHYFRKRLFE